MLTVLTTDDVFFFRAAGTQAATPNRLRDSKMGFGSRGVSVLDRCRTPGKSRDILANPKASTVLFLLPAIAIAVTEKSVFAGWRTVVWTGSLTIMGTACTINAARCGRVHCYVTGPFFLVMAVVTLLYGIGILPLGGHGWNLISLTILVGAVALCCLPEVIFGKYRGAGTGHQDHC